ncbi:MAG: chemotaxis protein CheB [Clostridiales bacterium]|nr:chemotaxis protein CheB [Clostridiales bacterium]
MFKAIVIGTSAGGLVAAKELLTILKHPYPLPIIIIQHLSPSHESYLPKLLSETGHMVLEVDEKTPIEKGKVYVAPPNYHVLIEKDYTFSLTVEARESYARPSIDVTFETASDAYKHQLIGILLTGANHDGAKGMKRIFVNKGFTIVQDPKTAHAEEMPVSALKLIKPDKILSINEIGHFLNDLVH